MTTATSPSKPLKILTIDGGGLQAISTLVILDELLSTIAKNNGVHHRKPRPCDVFDTIAGIGAGGWLALLLGRFHMDITACLSEWYKITQNIAPRSGAQAMRMRMFHHCYFDPDRLVDQINNLTKTYGTGDYLYADSTKGVRTRHVFVAALRSDSRDYSLFRTYAIPDSAKLPLRLREGPANPAKYKISRAFGVTGAARYFTSPWKERMAKSGKTHFIDHKFPEPHNITELALDEMWGLYGTEVPLSVIVNIGPGLPNEHDVRAIAKRFSWPSNVPAKVSSNPKRPRSPIVEEERQPKKRTTLEISENNNLPTTEGPSVRFEDPKGDSKTSVSGPLSRKQQLTRYDTFGSIRDRRFEEKQKRLEIDIERDVKLKLDNIYKGGSELYYRLALSEAPLGTTLNDSSAVGPALEAATRYLDSSFVSKKIDKIARTYQGGIEISAA